MYHYPRAMEVTLTSIPQHIGAGMTSTEKLGIPLSTLWAETWVTPPRRLEDCSCEQRSPFCFKLVNKLRIIEQIRIIEQTCFMVTFLFFWLPFWRSDVLFGVCSDFFEYWPLPANPSGISMPPGCVKLSFLPAACWLYLPDPSSAHFNFNHA